MISFKLLQEMSDFVDIVITINFGLNNYKYFRVKLYLIVIIYWQYYV